MNLTNVPSWGNICQNVPKGLMYWLIIESNMRKLPSFSKSNFSSYSWCSTNTWFYYVISKFDPILITRLRNNCVISLVIRLKDHYVDSQFDTILITRLRVHYITYVSLNKCSFLKDWHISAVLNVFQYSCENQNYFFK